MFFLTTGDKNSICVKVSDDHGMSVIHALEVEVCSLKIIKI